MTGMSQLRRTLAAALLCTLVLVLQLTAATAAAKETRQRSAGSVGSRGRATSRRRLAGATGSDAAPSSAGTGAGTAAATTWSPLWQHYNDLYPADKLIPTITTMIGHEVLYQIPPSPRATLFIAHGCNHAAHDWWPNSPACPQCLGLPEEQAHTHQALARGYAVIAMTSISQRGDNCMNWDTNHQDAAAILRTFLKENKLSHLPLYGMGVSVGGGFVLKLPQFIRMHGVLSEVLGPHPQGWQPGSFPDGHPPTVFVAMDRDWDMAARISTDAATLKQLSVPVVTVRVPPRPVPPTFFSDRSSRVLPEVSRKAVAALRQLGMLDEAGMVTVDPRHTKVPWVQQLVELVPELSGGMLPDHSQVWEEMNLAWSTHEIIADFATAAFLWFESGGQADFSQLLSLHAPPGSGFVGDAADAIPADQRDVVLAASLAAPHKKKGGGGGSSAELAMELASSAQLAAAAAQQQQQGQQESEQQGERDSTDADVDANANANADALVGAEAGDPQALGQSSSAVDLTTASGASSADVQLTSAARVLGAKGPHRVAPAPTPAPAPTHASAPEAQQQEQEEQQQAGPAGQAEAAAPAGQPADDSREVQAASLADGGSSDGGGSDGGSSSSDGDGSNSDGDGSSSDGGGSGSAGSSSSVDATSAAAVAAVTTGQGGEGEGAAATTVGTVVGAVVGFAAGVGLLAAIYAASRRRNVGFEAVPTVELGAQAAPHLHPQVHPHEHQYSQHSRAGVGEEDDP